MQTRFDTRMLREQVPGPVEPAGSRLVTGDDERHDLIDQLALAHGRAALLVTAVHQHGDVVEVLLGGGTPLRDQLRHELRQ